MSKAVERRTDDDGVWGTRIVDENGGGGSQPGAATYYSVELDYTDLTDDGDNVTIWTPSAGDMIVAFALTWQNYTPWDHGPYLILGQNLNPGDLVPAGDPNDNNYWIYQDFTQALVPEFAYNYVSITETGGGGQGSQNSNYFVPAVGVPIKVQLVNNDGIPATQGHADFVFAVVTPTTP